MPSTKPRQKTWIPESVKALFGRRNSFSEYVEPGDVKAVKRSLATAELRHHAMFAAVDRLPDDVKQLIMAKGGDVLALRGRLAELDSVPFDYAAERMRSLEHAAKTRSENSRQVSLAVVDMIDRAQVETEALRPLMLTAEPAAEFSFQGLFDHWAKGGAKKPRHYQATAKLLRECYGNVDYRELNPAKKEGWKFADYMSANEVGPASQDNHVGRARAMYKAASRYLVHGNPFADVKPVDVYHERQKGKFTREQLTALLHVVEEHRFGNTRQHRRASEVLWMLTLAVYTGARINEVASLRKGDVLRYSDANGSFPYLYFRADAVKAQAGEDKSRKVPLHPDIAASFEAYAKAAKGSHIFGAFEDSKDNGRAAWLVSNLPAFMREHAKEMGIALNSDGEIVDEDGKPLSLHSVRHSFHVAVSSARLHADAQRILVGHAGRDVHDRVYNSGPDFHLLYQDMCKVRPLG